MEICYLDFNARYVYLEVTSRKIGTDFRYLFGTITFRSILPTYYNYEIRTTNLNFVNKF